MTLSNSTVKLFFISIIFISFLLYTPILVKAQESGFNFPGLDDQGFNTGTQIDPSRFETNDRGVTSAKDERSALVRCDTAQACTFNEFTKTFSRIVDLLLATAVAMSTIIFVYAGLLYLTAADNAGKRSQANQMIRNAVIGFFIAAAAWLLVEVFINTLEGNKDVIKVDEFNIDKN